MPPGQNDGLMQVIRRAELGQEVEEPENERLLDCSENSWWTCENTASPNRCQIASPSSSVSVSVSSSAGIFHCVYVCVCVGVSDSVCMCVSWRGKDLPFGKSFQGIIECSKLVKRNGNYAAFWELFFLFPSHSTFDWLPAYSRAAVWECVGSGPLVLVGSRG